MLACVTKPTDDPDPMIVQESIEAGEGLSPFPQGRHAREDPPGRFVRRNRTWRYGKSRALWDDCLEGQRIKKRTNQRSKEKRNRKIGYFNSMHMKMRMN